MPTQEQHKIIDDLTEKLGNDDHAFLRALRTAYLEHIVYGEFPDCLRSKVLVPLDKYEVGDELDGGVVECTGGHFVAGAQLLSDNGLPADTTMVHYVSVVKL